MLDEAGKTLAADERWLGDARGRLHAADEALDRAFHRLLMTAD